MKKYGDDLDQLHEKKDKDVFWLTAFVSQLIILIATVGLVGGVFALFGGGGIFLLIGSLGILLLAMIPRVLAEMGNQQKVHYAKVEAS